MFRYDRFAYSRLCPAGRAECTHRCSAASCFVNDGIVAACVCAVCWLVQVDKAMELLHQMKRSGIEKDIYCYNAAMHG